MDEVKVIVASSAESKDETDKGASTARKALVADILARISHAKGAHKDAFKRMEADMDLAFYGYDPAMWSDEKYVVNLAQRHVQQRPCTPRTRAAWPSPASG